MNTSLGMDRNLTFTITLAEALVLSDCLDRLNREDLLSPLCDRAEQVALWALDGALERQNPVVLSADYANYLKAAKSYITRGMDE